MGLFEGKGARTAVRKLRAEVEPVADGNGTEPSLVLDLILCRAGERDSHRVGAPATVALLADDRGAEMLRVGERESVERLRRTQTT